MAMGVGASGILGGRAFWKEYFLQEVRRARSQFAATTARKRLADVDALVRAQGTPWFARYGFTKEELATIRAAEGWHIRYGPNKRPLPALAPQPLPQATCTEGGLRIPR